MRNRTKISLMFVALVAILAACSPAAAPAEKAMPDAATATEALIEKPEATEAMMEKPEATDEMMAESSPTEAMMEEKPAPTEEAGMMELPAWFAAPLTNARSGETFTIKDSLGKVVLLETMAIWCSTCARQQMEVVELHNLLGEREDFISVGLDIDPNEDAQDLKSYIENNGYHWVYAVAPVEVAAEIGDLYGVNFLNPPSAPMLIIDRHGAVHPLPFGVKSAADLQQALEPFLAEMP